MLVDYHMHTEDDDYAGKCPYTLARLEEYVAAARARGVDEIAITEHCHRFHSFWPLLAPVVEAEDLDPRARRWLRQFFTEDLAEYVAVIREAQERGLPVKLGIEVDYLPGSEALVQEVLAPHPWDLVLGSIHFLGTWSIDFAPDVGWPQADVDAAYAEYFAALARAADSGLFDVLAHPDLIKKFGHRSAKSGPAVAAALDRIAASGACVELSTAGRYRPVGEFYPTSEILTACRERGIPLTLASDAHRPAEVGRDVAAAAAVARRCGYQTVTVLTRRRKAQHPLG